MSIRPARSLTRDRLGEVSISPGLPLDAAMIGASVSAAPEIAAKLHALCPHAHRLAVMIALGMTISPNDRDALRLERLKMAALRFGLHWPTTFGARPHAALAQALLAFAHRDENALIQAVRQCLNDCEAIAAQAIAALGALQDPEAPGALLSDRFAQMRAHTERLLQAGLSPAVSGGQGFARVETLRGPLLVSLNSSGDVITAFESEAPSDRLLRPDGPAVRACRQATDEAQARVALLALDPCVDVEVTFERETADA